MHAALQAPVGLVSADIDLMKLYYKRTVAARGVATLLWQWIKVKMGLRR